MDETRNERIARLTEEFRRLLEEKFPEKLSTMQRIEELTEEIGREIERRIGDDATKQEGRGFCGSWSICECGGMARYVRDYEKRVISLHGVACTRLYGYFVMQLLPGCVTRTELEKGIPVSSAT